VRLAEALQRAGEWRRVGSGFRIRCPAHCGEGFNCTIWVADGDVRFSCKSRGCDWRDIRAALLGRPLQAAAPGSERPPLDDVAKRRERAQRVWREGAPLDGTLGEKYLNSRGITLLSPALRFCRRLRHPTGTYLPAIVAAITHVRTERKVIAVYRTYLSQDGHKTSLEPAKAALGPIAGGAVRLAPAAERLAIAEGIETAFSVLQATGIATWASLGSSNRIELPEVVREVILCVDADAAGAEVARKIASVYVREGRCVKVARPSRFGADFNDELMGR
jgi:hypothetical protein